MDDELGTATALSVGIEPTSTTQYRRSQQRLFEYKVDLLFLTLASVNELSGSFAMLQRFSSDLASTKNVTLKIGASWQGHYAHEIKE